MRQVVYRIRNRYRCAPSAKDRDRLVWLGSGLDGVGLVVGESVRQEAALALMAGCHLVTGARLVRRKVAVHAHGRLPGEPLAQGLHAAAAAGGVEPVELIGDPDRASFTVALQAAELSDTLYPTRALSMNAVNASTVASGCSSGMKCPASGMTTPVTLSAQGLMEAAMSGIEPWELEIPRTGMVKRPCPGARASWFLRADSAASRK
jgi:hypothetical protein